jgi:hypothetical protein
MPKRRLDRYYYRNGQIRLESRIVNGQFHGLCRTWHNNGQLAEELRYRHGRLHGTSRQWDENGRFLGSFTMNYGTGTQHYWHDNGQLRMEITSVNGKFHGRMRDWLQDGTLIHEDYCINNRDATRAAYLKVASKHPDWPQYEGQPAGKVARDNATLELRKFELFIERLLNKSHAEARQWLSAVKNPNLRSLARFRTSIAALRFVETLYAAGAVSVIAALIYAGRHGKQFADRLLIKLPKSSSKRKALRKICQDLCDKRGGAFLPDVKDTGESHLFLLLE